MGTPTRIDRVRAEDGELGRRREAFDEELVHRP
jgi:hypothetical protein